MHRPKCNSLELSLNEANEKNTIQIKRIKRNILEKPVTREKVKIQNYAERKKNEHRSKIWTKKFMRADDNIYIYYN